MKSLNTGLFSLLFIFQLSAQASRLKHHVIAEDSESGQVKYTVIEEDATLRQNQERVSQRVIFRKISYANDPHILKEALAQKSNEDLRTITRAGLPLWTTTKNTWTPQDEVDYQAWFSANASTQFNMGSALLADCADTGLLFRWAYAHDKKLPMANTLSGSGKLFGHFSGSSAWDKLKTDPDWKKDERFKEAMRYLFENTYTHSIFDDLYPTQINPTYVHPGSMYMIIRKSSGHTQTIYKIDKANAGMRTLWGNEPSAERIYESWFIWEPAVQNVFGSWRWPTNKSGTWKLTAPKNMPGFSEEQFTKRKELGESLFQTWVLDGLGLVDYDEVKATREIQTVKDGLDYRLTTTAMGAMLCGYTPCDPLGTVYDSYSTNSRDARLIQAQKDLLKTIATAGGMNSTPIQNALAKTKIDNVLLSGFGYTFKDFILTESLLTQIKADANLTFNQRWGFDQFPDNVTQFKMYDQQIKMNLYNRINSVDTAQYYCIQNKCDPAANYVIALNTAKMDEGFSKLSGQLASLVNAPEIQGPVLDEVYNSYKTIRASNWYVLASPSCEDPASCSMYDVLWKDDGLTRVKTWKSDPTDATNSRWGL